MMFAYEVDDEPTIYAAYNAWEAASLYTADSGVKLERGYPRMLTDAELDAERSDRPAAVVVGVPSTIRRWLEAAKEPGYLAGAVR